MALDEPALPDVASPDGTASVWPDRIRSMLLELKLRDDGRLPSERWLTEQCNISRMTVRKALWQLEAEGLIHRFDRSGWFLSPPRFRYAPAHDVSFTAAVKAQGRVPGSVVLQKEELPASSEIAADLGVPEEEPIYRIRRLRLIDARPAFLELSHVVAARCPGLLAHVDEDVSLATVYQRHYGLVLKRRQVAMHPTALLNPHARDLRLAPGTPGLFLKRLTHDDAGQPVTFDQEYWRHDALIVEVTVGAQA
ncbi:MAG: GntR family transcriptional regulator [Bosea sp. (in: a-proteobacteria)]